MAINKKALEAAISGTKAERHYLCGKDFSLFFCYYFSEYIKYPFAPFHFDFFDDVKKMHDGTYREVAWIGFRECSKTSFAKIYLTWLIVYKKKMYINVDSYSTTNAERILFDIILNLQTNKLLVSDFGHLYNAKRDENETTQKRVNNFVTNNGVRVEAHSTGKSVRGRLHGNQRPDCHKKGTIIFNEGRWDKVEEFQGKRFPLKEKGIDVKIYSLPYTETVTNTHRYWTKYIPLKTVKKTTSRKQTEVYEDWTYAQNLTKHHYIGLKINNTVNKKYPLLETYKAGSITERNNKGTIFKSKGGSFKKEVPSEFYNKDWWWLFGLWWGDGHLSGKYNKDSTVGLTIANTQMHIQKRVFDILKKNNIKYSINPKEGCFQVTFSNAVIGRWLRTWRIDNSMKKPPTWVETIPLNFQKELILGYIDSDGFTDYKNNEVRITSVYLDGLYYARRILARLGVASSIREGIDGNNNYEIKGVKCKTKKKYDLRFREGAKNIGFNIENQTRYTYSETFIKDGYLWSKVQSINESEPVEFCPIQTEDHTYITNFGTSHNCLLLDDFETNDTKDSKLTTQSIIAHIDEFKSGLDSSANVLYLGNLITEHGSVATLYERAKTDYRLKVRQIDAETDGKPTWDTKYTMTDEEADAKNEHLTENKYVSLEDKKRQLGSLVYSAEMMNQPVSEKSGIFKKEMFKYISREEMERKNTRKFATIDSALSKDADSDATGVVRNYVDDQNFWHISGKAYRINPKGLIDLIFQLYDEGMEKIGIETTTFTQAIQPFFEDECRKRKKYPHIVQLKHGGVRKETRIEALVPYYETKSIYHIEGEVAEMEQQLYKFPMGLHEDIIDALQYQRFIAQSSSKAHKPATSHSNFVYNPRTY